MEFAPMTHCWVPNWDPLYFILQVICAFYCLIYGMQARALALQSAAGRRFWLQSSPLPKLRWAAFFATAVFAHNVLEDLWILHGYRAYRGIPDQVWAEWTSTLVVALIALVSLALWQNLGEKHVAPGVESSYRPLRLGLV